MRIPFRRDSIGGGALPCFICNDRRRDGVAVGVDSTVTIPNLSFVFKVPVIIARISLGLGPSLCSAILGALAFNFFLTEPRYSFVVIDQAKHLGDRTAVLSSDSS
jgi:K+-sensing histidine kinase KdpD